MQILASSQVWGGGLGPDSVQAGGVSSTLNLSGGTSLRPLASVFVFGTPTAYRRAASPCRLLYRPARTERLGTRAVPRQVSAYLAQAKIFAGLDASLYNPRHITALWPLRHARSVLSFSGSNARRSNNLALYPPRAG